MTADAKREWHNLLVTAMVDGDLDPEEELYLNRLRDELGLTEDDVRTIRAEWEAEGGSIKLTRDSEEREAALFSILKMMHVDDHIDPKEKRLLMKLAHHIEMPANELDRMIEKARSTVAGERIAAEKEAVPLREAPEPIPGEIHEKTGIELMPVPAGTFIFGDMAVGGLDKARKIGAYKIGKYPVTNAQWMTFESETGYTGRLDFGPSFNGPDQPLVGVNFEDAKAFCEWAGLRLPNEVEWERAARGTDGRRYPWGGMGPGGTYGFPSEEQAHFSMSFMDTTKPRTVPVTTKPHSMSPVGCYHMVGNVDEWCDNGRPDQRGRHPVRGGNWLSAPYALNTYYHAYWPADTREDTIGFRVVADV